MAIDTKTKRLNMLQFGRPFVVALPEPDNVIGAANRAHLSQWYLVSGSQPSDNPPSGWTISRNQRIFTISRSLRVWTVHGQRFWTIRNPRDD